jgi:hypothetical protein
MRRYCCFCVAAGFIVLLGYFFPEQLNSLSCSCSTRSRYCSLAVLVGIGLAAVKWKNSAPVKKGGVWHSASYPC